MFGFLGGRSSSTGSALSIGRLLSRVEHSSVVDERIDALKQLNDLGVHALTKHGAVEHLTRILVQTADHFIDDEDVHVELLQTLTLMTSPPTGRPDERDTIQGDDEQDKEPLPVVATGQECIDNVDMILANDMIVDVLQRCINEQHALMIRLYALRLLLQLLRARGARLQDDILIRPGFIKLLIEILAGNREVIRNETILVFDALVKENTAIQGIAAFEGVFEILLGVANDEGGNGIIVIDCYTLVLALLTDNASNANYFRELDCVKLLAPLLVSAHKAAIASPTPPPSLPSMSPSTSPMSGDRGDSAPPSALLMIFRIINALDSYGQARPHLASPVMLEAMFPVIDDTDAVPSTIRCGLLRVVGRCMLNCVAARVNLSKCTIASEAALIHLVHMALNGKDIDQCSNALFVVENFYLDNAPAQLEAVSMLAPVPDSGSTQRRFIGPELIHSLNLWQTDRKSLRDPLRYWITARLLALLIRRNDTAKQIAMNTALSEPVDDRAPPRLLDTCIRVLQAAFDTAHTDARVRSALLLLLCECLLESRDTACLLLESPHLTESLLALSTWTSSDPVISGLGSFVWALCLCASDADEHRPALRRIITSIVTLERFNSSLAAFRDCPDLLNARSELDNEPMSLMRIVQFDEYFRAEFNRVLALCDSRILSIVVNGGSERQASPAAVARTTVVVSSPVAQHAPVPDPLDAKRISQASARIEQLEVMLDDAMGALASKTDEAALANYRLHLANSEHEALASEHNQLLQQHEELLLLLASFQSLDSKAPERGELSDTFPDLS